MYQLIAHDGVRFVKLVLLFNQQATFINHLFENNKFIVKKGTFISRPDSTLTLLIDNVAQLKEETMDRKSAKIRESYFDIKGLPIKYTNAPKFKFINNDKTKTEYVEQLEEEVEDENADLFKKFDVPDLSAHERCYINKFQQLGFWRKKF